jgi:predicted PurR-regulated permease PerM
MSLNLDLNIALAVSAIIGMVFGFIYNVAVVKLKVDSQKETNTRIFTVIDEIKNNFLNLKEQGSIPFNNLKSQLDKLENSLTEISVTFHKATPQLERMGKLEETLLNFQMAIEEQKGEIDSIYRFINKVNQ